MKSAVASLLLAAMSGSSEARPHEAQLNARMFGPAELQAFTAPQAVSMVNLKQEKISHRESQRAAGTYDLNKYERAGPAACVNGTAAGYACNRVDLMGFLRHQDMGATKVLEGNDIWGWTSADGREFGAVGQAEGTAFVEVKSDGSLVYLGRLPTQTEPSTWRDMKVIKNHVYIGSEAEGHGLQIFDMRKLLTIDPASPVTFPLSSLTAHFDGFGSSHNVVANEETNMIYVVGTERSLPCRAGLWMIDVFHPERPQDMGCVSSDGYVHDAQCVIYKGPQVAYQGREICFNYNEDALTIVDVTRKPTPVMLSRTTYKGATYTHQGWLANADMTYLLLDDELDEQRQNGPAADQRTTTYVVDITDLKNPVFKSVYKSPQKSIDHNQYVIDGVSYQSNYGSGLRIVDVRSVGRDEGASSGFMEAGYFDCRPEDDAVGGQATFDGSWSVYPYFKSGYILLNSIERGVFSLKYHG
ncbi:regulatory P domain-containing protein [Apiospora arundinis]|uniref:Regulatory P domain-containing protein n=1 Tax=Apiospora arundinis TaxID=335852 RepID=A0ABR2I360_9PEZI